MVVLQAHKHADFNLVARSESTISDVPRDRLANQALLN